MKRMKRHKIKKEKLEGSSQQREQEEHDLAYYIHDRVELMHQVFSMLKYKELKSMAPECVRNLAIGDLQELCTEELLGISSKRLLAILDGAEPPSDTESSSPSPPPDQLETISLDSISSDEELLASSNKKKKHKHRRRGSKSKKKEKSKEPDTQVEENSELSKASRAGLTVLELLELQARARAIRAQLQQEQANKRPSLTTVESSHHSSDNEVEIKEEAPDVVEISSEDEKPDINQLEKNIAEKTTPSKVTDTETVKESDTQQNSQVATKRINDLIITVPQAKPTRKIKLNRNKVTVSVSNDSASASAETRSVAIVTKITAEKVIDSIKNTPEKSNESKSKKKRKEKKKKTVEKDGSDHDEIMLQLSDSEKMDLFEALDESRKNYDKVSSSSEDTETSSSDSDDENGSYNISGEKPLLVETVSSTEIVEEKDKNTSSTYMHSSFIETSSIKNIEDSSHENNSPIIKENDFHVSKEVPIVTEHQNKEIGNDVSENHCSTDQINKNLETMNTEKNNNLTENQNNEITLVNESTESSTAQNATIDDNLLVATNETRCLIIEENCFNEKLTTPHKDDSPIKSLLNEEKVLEICSIEDMPSISNSSTNNTDKGSMKNNESAKENEKDLSDGELSDHQSSEVETIDVQPEIVCISDEEKPKNKYDKKKKKKAKKEKKSKKSKSDFREGADQNFYRDANDIKDGKNQENKIKSPLNVTNALNSEKPIDLDSDDVYEILELSDDSSCYEVEGTVLSKEPTAEEIEALSAKIDEIEREDVITDKQIREHEQMTAEKEISKQSDENVDNISWKDRYLGSNKVKKVLTTANIFNALRKKNKELKKKIEDSKKKNDKDLSNDEETVTKEINIQLEEGSIEQYNALQGSTKYVDPVMEPTEENKEAKDNKEDEKIVTKVPEKECVTKEMKKDAKQLLKMYKKLLKYNDMNKLKDPNKKKKKKQRKKDRQDNISNQ